MKTFNVCMPRKLILLPMATKAGISSREGRGRITNLSGFRLCLSLLRNLVEEIEGMIRVGILESKLWIYLLGGESLSCIFCL